MEESSRRTPSVKELKQILFGGKRFGNHVDEVWPSLFIGDVSVANDRYVLWKLGISHVVNAAHGSKYCQGGCHFYGPSVDYYGVPADDSPSFDLSPYFLPCARYIDNALNTAGASVLVHCAVGVSRSASLVLAYLMIGHGLSLLEAVRKVKERRWIFPNVGFLKQLRALDRQLSRETPPPGLTFKEDVGRIILGDVKIAKNVTGYIATEEVDGLQKWSGSLARSQAAKVAQSDRPRRARSLAGLGDASARYESPPASELQRLMWTKTGSECNHMDEVQPRIFLGDMYAAKDKRGLRAHGISHVLNAAHGKFNVNTGAAFYRDVKLTYHGVEAFDMVTFNLSAFFYSAADFIRSALSSATGRVLVHCAMGLSRSSTLVLAYLMIHERMTLAEAIAAVSAKRNISPNLGFLEQLRALDAKLQSANGKT